MSSPPNTDRDLLAEVLTSLIVARRAEIVERLSGAHEPKTGALPTSTTLLAYLFDAAGLRCEAGLSVRTFQRQKAGERTANTSDVTLHRLVRLFVDALEVERLPNVNVECLADALREELATLCAAWDRFVGAVHDAFDPVATRHAVLRVAMIELAVRRAALLRAIGVTEFEPWFATASHPIDRAIHVGLARHGVSLDALRRELGVRGIGSRTFESWRHERQLPPLDKLEVVANAIVDLAQRSRGTRARTQLVAMLRCARAAKKARRDLTDALGAHGDEVLADACRGHERLCEIVFDVLGDEDALKTGVAFDVLTRPTSDWAANLRASSRFDGEARRVLAADQSWLVNLVEESNPAATLLRQLSQLPLDGRLDAFRMLLAIGLLQPETTADVYPRLRDAALHEMAWVGPRSTTFKFLVRRVAASITSAALREDLHGVCVAPLDRLVELVTRADVLAMAAEITREQGLEASHVDGLVRELLLFERELPS